MAKAARKTEVVETVETTETESTLSMTAAQRKAVEAMTTVSARIRYLDSEGYTRSQISKLIPNASGNPLRYQHVRNVLEGPTPKGNKAE